MKWVLLFNLFSFFFAGSVLAASGFAEQNLWLSKSASLEGDAVSIHALIVNSEEGSLEGEVLITDDQGSQSIGSPQAFVLKKGESRILIFDWKATAGSHAFQARIQNAFFVTNGKRISADQFVSSDISTSVFVDVDTDKDGLGDQTEVQKGSDPKKSDSDGDGLSDSADPNPVNEDADGDGDKDSTDPDPLNSRIFTPPDVDKDGDPDVVDSDQDNDGLYNFEEEEIGSDPRVFDTDHDGVSDGLDDFPTDPNQVSRDGDVQIDQIAVALSANRQENVDEKPIPSSDDSGQVKGVKEIRQTTESKERNVVNITLATLSLLLVLSGAFFIFFRMRTESSGKFYTEKKGKL